MPTLKLNMIMSCRQQLRLSHKKINKIDTNYSDSMKQTKERATQY